MPISTTPESIRDFRNDRGWSQGEFAKRVAAKKRTVEDWEGGRRAPPAMLALVMLFIKQRESLAEQLDRMQAGELRQRLGSDDVTQKAIEHVEQQLAEYDRLLESIDLT